MYGGDVYLLITGSGCYLGFDKVSATPTEDAENSLLGLWHVSPDLSSPAIGTSCGVAENTSVLEMWEQYRPP